MWRFKVLPVPLDFSDANLCPLNSGPLDLNRLKFIDDILNRLKCQNVKRQKHITEEPIRKHFISMPWTVVSSKFGVNFITITNVILLVIYIIIAASLDLTSQKLYRTTIIWFSPWLLHVCQQCSHGDNQGHTWQYAGSIWQYAGLIGDYIITDVRLLVVLLLNENITIWKNIKISGIFTKT